MKYHEELGKAAKEITMLLQPKVCPDPVRLQELHDKWKSVSAIKKIFDNDYDRRVTRPGWGSENCSCHIAPPCQSCVDFTNAMSEDELEEHLLSLK